MQMLQPALLLHYGVVVETCRPFCWYLFLYRVRYLWEFVSISPKKAYMHRVSAPLLYLNVYVELFSGGLVTIGNIICLYTWTLTLS